MKRAFALILLLVIMNGIPFSEGIAESNSVEIVRSAYNRVLDSNADGDAAYNEIYDVIYDLKLALLLNDSQERDYARVKLFGWEDESSNKELDEKADELLTFIVGPKDDKLSALMSKFAVMTSVNGIIEPTKVDIEVKNMEKFVAEIGLCEKATGYVLAMLDIYFFSGEAVQFTEKGFRFKWQAIDGYNAYHLNLGNAANLKNGATSSNTSELRVGSKGDDVLKMKERLLELGYFTKGSMLNNQYNEKTAERVKLFQKTNGLSQTGKADEETLNVLYSDSAKMNPNE